MYVEDCRIFALKAVRVDVHVRKARVHNVCLSRARFGHCFFLMWKFVILPRVALAAFALQLIRGMQTFPFQEYTTRKDIVYGIRMEEENASSSSIRRISICF